MSKTTLTESRIWENEMRQMMMTLHLFFLNAKCVQAVNTYFQFGRKHRVEILRSKNASGSLAVSHLTLIFDVEIFKLSGGAAPW